MFTNRARGPCMLAIVVGLFFASSLQAATYYVDASIASSGNGESWPTAKKTIQEALAINGGVVPGDIILVGGGTVQTPKVYKPSSQSTSIELKSGVSIQGGLAGYGAQNPDARDHDMYRTILSGDLIGNDEFDPETYEQTHADNAYNVVVIPEGVAPPAQAGPFANRANLDGFEITGGYGGGMEQAGAGILAWDHDDQDELTIVAIIRDCKVYLE